MDDCDHETFDGVMERAGRAKVELIIQPLKILCGISHKIQTLQILYENSTNYQIQTGKLWANQNGKTVGQIIIIMPSLSERPTQEYFKRLINNIRSFNFYVSNNVIIIW